MKQAFPLALGDVLGPAERGKTNTAAAKRSLGASRRSFAARTGWRIVKKRDAANAFDGDGARRFGGRWNSPGVPMVYVASSRSLAVLEMAVHLDPPALLSSFVLIPCEFDESLVTTLGRSALPALWRRDPPLPALAAIGDAWTKQARSAVLAVPSAIIEEELNFLLNPTHPDFSRVSIGEARDFSFDARLIK